MRVCAYAITILLIAAALTSACGQRDRTRLVLAATTSLEDTGLLDTLSARFAKDHPEIELSPIAVGTGQAIQLARHGDADVVLSHDSAGEMELVASGLARSRQNVMYNDFVIAGPAANPAAVSGSDPIGALKAIANRRALFISRGDDSGTHRKEMKLWNEAGVDPRTAGGDWYVEAGLGMGDALILADQKQAYILTDRGTFLRFRSRIALTVLCEHDPRLLNKYAVTVMNGKRIAAAQTFAEWLTSEGVQRLIGDFGRVELGEALFTPSAHGAGIHDTIPTGERSSR